MLLLLVVFLFVCQSAAQLNLYHTRNRTSSLDRDCLYYSALNPSPVQQVHSYCIRSPLDEAPLDHANYNDQFTLQRLYERKVTVGELYTWSAPIDLIEEYQISLNNPSTISTSTSYFYNCTHPWFGSRCEYTFDQVQFIDTQSILHHLFTKTFTISQRRLEKLACYTHIRCNRAGLESVMCLDWREVCDGKVDCTDGGLDEEQCWRLEFNECDADGEFRCRNGLCIPIEFLQDDRVNPECLDRTDEPFLDVFLGSSPAVNAIYGFKQCLSNPGFQCEDRACHWSLKDLPILSCGNGDCKQPFGFDCESGRNALWIEAVFKGINTSKLCHWAFLCYSNVAMASDFLAGYCNETTAQQKYSFVEKHCPRLIILPSVFFGHVQLVYAINGIQVSRGYRTR